MSAVLSLLAFSDREGENDILDRAETQRSHMELGQQHCAEKEVTLREQLKRLINRTVPDRVSV